MLNDQLDDDVLSPDHAHVLDEARVDVPDTERLDVPNVDRRSVEDECAGHCEELEAASECLSPL